MVPVVSALPPLVVAVEGEGVLPLFDEEEELEEPPEAPIPQ